jgi:N-acyl-D-amino-acid deacylase
LLERLRDPAQRQAMKHNPRPMWRLVAERRWDEIRLLRSDAHAGLVGMTFSEIGRRLNADPMDAALDLLEAEGAALGNVMWTSRGFDDADVLLCLEQAECAVMPDTQALSPRGPLANSIGSLSGYGWVARLPGHYVRDVGVLTLAEAVRRITSLPAARLGLADRGRPRGGAVADLVVFDPARVRDVSSVPAPRRHPEGFDHLVLGGVPTLSDGRHTASSPGPVIRRA